MEKKSNDPLPFSVAVVYSKPTKDMAKSSFVATDDDTEISAIEVQEALQKHHIHAFLFPVTSETIDEISTIHADCIFNLIEWSGKDFDLAIKAMKCIENTGIPFTGASTYNYTISSDKKLMKELFDTFHIPTPKWQICVTGDEDIRTDFSFPVILKLELEHCSIGLSKDAIVEDVKDLKRKIKEKIKRFKQPILVEEYIEGRELQVTALVRDSKVMVLPACEVIFKEQGKDAFLTYESRWNEDHPDYKQSYVELAKLSKDLEKRLTDVCLALFTKLQYNDYTRVDIRLDKHEHIFILEANANPGLGDEDEYAMTVSYRAEGYTFDMIIMDILKSAMKRFGKSVSINPSLER